MFLPNDLALFNDATVFDRFTPSKIVSVKVGALKGTEVAHGVVSLTLHLADADFVLFYR
jgi:hypothetical protein